ncbi:hypothetical protein AA313_de0209042 [Arthrobotrys entomopaga]|nr:hypothetical protein AA313_de0209042 [Arthrobotrys entomopaga]
MRLKKSMNRGVSLVTLLVCLLSSTVNGYRPKSHGSPSRSNSNHANAFSNYSMALQFPSLKFPGTLNLSKRQEEETCTLPEPWIPCADGIHCCPATDKCCPGTEFCCPDDTKCYPDGMCCPNAAETCDKGFCLRPGQTCCGESACDVDAECMTSPSGAEICCEDGEPACEDGCCEDGSQCMTSEKGTEVCCKEGYFACDFGDCCKDGDQCMLSANGSKGCCPVDHFPCDNGIYCCPDGSKCVESGFPSPCERMTTTTSKTTTTTTTTTTTKKETTTKKLTTTTTSTTTTKKPSTTTSSATMCSPTKNLSTDPADPGDYMEVNGECLPIFDFPILQGLTEQACGTICNGETGRYSNPKPKS